MSVTTGVMMHTVKTHTLFAAMYFQLTVTRPPVTLMTKHDINNAISVIELFPVF